MAAGTVAGGSSAPRGFGSSADRGLMLLRRNASTVSVRENTAGRSVQRAASATALGAGDRCMDRAGGGGSTASTCTAAPFLHGAGATTSGPSGMSTPLRSGPATRQAHSSTGPGTTSQDGGRGSRGPVARRILLPDSVDIFDTSGLAERLRDRIRLRLTGGDQGDRAAGGADHRRDDKSSRRLDAVPAARSRRPPREQRSQSAAQLHAVPAVASTAVAQVPQPAPSQGLPPESPAVSTPPVAEGARDASAAASGPAASSDTPATSGVAVQAPAPPSSLATALTNSVGASGAAGPASQSTASQRPLPSTAGAPLQSGAVTPPPAPPRRDQGTASVPAPAADGPQTKTQQPTSLVSGSSSTRGPGRTTASVSPTRPRRLTTSSAGPAALTRTAAGAHAPVARLQVQPRSSSSGQPARTAQASVPSRGVAGSRTRSLSPGGSRSQASPVAARLGLGSAGGAAKEAAAVAGDDCPVSTSEQPAGTAGRATVLPPRGGARLHLRLSEGRRLCGDAFEEALRGVSQEHVPALRGVKAMYDALLSQAIAAVGTAAPAPLGGVGSRGGFGPTSAPFTTGPAVIAVPSASGAAASPTASRSSSRPQRDVRPSVAMGGAAAPAATRARSAGGSSAGPGHERGRSSPKVASTRSRDYERENRELRQLATELRAELEAAEAQVRECHPVISSASVPAVIPPVPPLLQNSLQLGPPASQLDEEAAAAAVAAAASSPLLESPAASRPPEAEAPGAQLPLGGSPPWAAAALADVLGSPFASPGQSTPMGKHSPLVSQALQALQSLYPATASLSGPPDGTPSPAAAWRSHPPESLGLGELQRRSPAGSPLLFASEASLTTSPAQEPLLQQVAEPLSQMRLDAPTSPVGAASQALASSPNAYSWLATAALGDVDASSPLRGVGEATIQWSSDHPVLDTAVPVAPLVHLTAAAEGMCDSSSSPSPEPYRRPLAAAWLLPHNAATPWRLESSLETTLNSHRSEDSCSLPQKPVRAASRPRSVPPLDLTGIGGLSDAEESDAEVAANAVGHTLPEHCADVAEQYEEAAEASCSNGHLVSRSSPSSYRAQGSPDKGLLGQDARDAAEALRHAISESSTASTRASPIAPQVHPLLVKAS